MFIMGGLWLSIFRFSSRHDSQAPFCARGWRSRDTQRASCRARSRSRDPVLEDTGTVRSVFSVSDNGTLAYVEGCSAAARKLIWVDRGGKKVAEIEGGEAYLWPLISRDGRKIAYTLESPAYDIWSYDIGRGVKTRLTFGSAAAEANLFQVWSPDGRWSAYTSIRSGKFTICRKPSDGSGSEEVLLEGTDQLRYPTDWSPDGKYLTYREPQQGVWTVWMLPLTGERKPYAFLHSQFPQSYAVFSPDSKWVAYCSNESGEAGGWLHSTLAWRWKGTVLSEHGHQSDVRGRQGERIEFRGRRRAHTIRDPALLYLWKLRCYGGRTAICVVTRYGTIQRRHHSGGQLAGGVEEEMSLATQTQA